MNKPKAAKALRAVNNAEQEPQPDSEEPTASKDTTVLSLYAEDPFGKRISTIFEHAQLTEIQAIFRAAISQHSMVLVSGPPGVGKTTAVRSVTDELPANKYAVVYLGQDQLGANVLQRLAESLGMQPKRFRPHVLMQISQWLSDNLSDGGKKIVVIVDECHLLDDQTLEDFRLLSNADYDRQSPFTLFLIAQPWLRTRLKSPFLEPLSQRLRYRYSFEGLGKAETCDYIRTRLAAANISTELYSDEALQAIFSASEGIPRRINNLCSHLLRKSKDAGAARIEVDMVKALVDSLDV